MAVRDRPQPIRLTSAPVNHGGRAEESLQSTIGVLPEIVATANGRVPVLIDGGFRRGTDVIEAPALGATAVCVGLSVENGPAAV